MEICCTEEENAGDLNPAGKGMGGCGYGIPNCRPLATAPASDDNEGTMPARMHAGTGLVTSIPYGTWQKSILWGEASSLVMPVCKGILRPVMESITLYTSTFHDLTEAASEWPENSHVGFKQNASRQACVRIF